MAQIIDQNDENDHQEGPAPSDSTAVSGDVSGSEGSAVKDPALPAHLQDLSDRARGYVEAASSAKPAAPMQATAFLPLLELHTAGATAWSQGSRRSDSPGRNP